MPAPVVDAAVMHAEVRVDGVLDEAAWASATPVTEFRRFQPSDGPAPTGHTEVRFLQDDDTLYVGVRVTGTALPIRARVSPREMIDSDDQIGLYLDPFHQARQGYIFYFNVLGIQQDLRFDNGEWSISWNAVLRSRGRVDEDGHGYTLEVALPFRSLKYPDSGGTQDWGVMVTRKIPGEGAKYAFPEMERNHPRIFTQAATLLVRPPARASGIELIPGVTLRQEASRGNLDEPFTWLGADRWRDIVVPSLDLRAGVGTNMALIATANPDFSQVEADITPVVLNRRFAYRFPEQRPFFTEGASELVDDADNLYTRSIVSPLYGLKLVGREGDWSVGILHTMDQTPSPTVNERGTPGFDEASVADRWSSGTVVRIRHDLLGAGQIGMTWADRRLVPKDFAVEQPGGPIKGAADNLAVDLTIPIGEAWTLRARHDQSLITADTLMGGSQTGLQLTRQASTGLGLAVVAEYLSPDYRQELGFRPQSGYVNAAGDLDWTFTPGGRVSTATPSLSAWNFAEVTGEHNAGASLGQSLLIDGIHRIDLSAAYTHRRELRETVDARVPGWWVNLAWSGQVGGAVELVASVDAGREMDFQDLRPTHRISSSLSAALRPARPLRIDVLARWQHFDRIVDDPDLPDVSDDLLLRTRIQVQFTRRWGLRVISAYNPVTGREATLESSGLLTYLVHPFTAFYVGYAQRDVIGDSTGTLSRSVFGKVHVWFRP